MPVGSKGATPLRRMQAEKIETIVSDYSKNTITFALVRGSGTLPLMQVVIPLLQRRDMITKHQFALHLIRDSTDIPNYLPQVVIPPVVVLP